MNCRQCESLEKRRDGENVCDECLRPIPKYDNMGGAGFESHSIHHFHTEEEGVKTLNLPVHLQLCHECYLKDFEKNYPGDPLPEIANVKGAEY